MEPINVSLKELCEILIEYAHDYIINDDNYWMDLVRPRLPAESIKELLKNQILPQLSQEREQANVLLLLAKLGRREVVPFAMKLKDSSDGIAQRFALRSLGVMEESVAFEMLETMYRKRLNNPNALNTVHGLTILETVYDIGSPKAEALAEKLIALGKPM